MDVCYSITQKSVVPIRQDGGQTQAYQFIKKVWESLAEIKDKGLNLVQKLPNKKCREKTVSEK